MDINEEQFNELDWTESPATVGFGDQDIADDQGKVL